jgi:hypothetical protein
MDFLDYAWFLACIGPAGLRSTGLRFRVMGSSDG